MAKYHNNNNNNKVRYRVNEQIRFSPVLVIGTDGQKIGVIAVESARQKAREAGLDLVEISPNNRPPVCRIMDFGKFKYEQSLKEKQARQQQKAGQLKEIRLSPRIQEHDIEIKCNSARAFLEEGHKVQFKLKYKNRELAHKDLGFKIMQNIIEILSDIGVSQNGAKLLEGNSLSCIIEPKPAKAKNDKPTGS